MYRLTPSVERDSWTSQEFKDFTVKIPLIDRLYYISNVQKDCVLTIRMDYNGQVVYAEFIYKHDEDNEFMKMMMIKKDNDYENDDDDDKEEDEEEKEDEEDDEEEEEEDEEEEEEKEDEEDEEEEEEEEEEAEDDDDEEEVEENDYNDIGSYIFFSKNAQLFVNTSIACKISNNVKKNILRDLTL